MPRFIESFLNFAGNFFYLLFGCSWAKSESFLRGQLLQAMLITVIKFLTWGPPGTLWKGRFPKPGRALSGVETDNLFIQLKCLGPLGHSLSRPLTIYVENWHWHMKVMLVEFLLLFSLKFLMIVICFILY